MVALALQVSASLTIAVALCAYSVAVTSERRRSQLAVVAVACGLLASLWVVSTSTLGESVLPTLAVLLAAWLAGQNTRGRRTYAAAVAERAAEREREREERLRRAVADERVVIARELHDIVAHAMSLIAVRSGVALAVRDSQPEEAGKALAIIETTARRALQEMRLLVGVLRRVDDRGAELNPAPVLAALDDLVDQAGQAGVLVHVQIDGEPRPLSAGADLSAYRIIQEALTNVVRHAGPTRAQLRLCYRRDEVTIDIVDEGSVRFDAARIDPGGGGHGLIGMRERAALYGGDLVAGPDGHGFGVHARLPTNGTA
jgi:signal transduction histidine kinase